MRTCICWVSQHTPMSNNIAKVLKFDTNLTIAQLQGKSVAIDLMPLLYAYLYVGKMDSAQGPLSHNGVVTSYLFGILNYLGRLRQKNIDCWVCLDGFSPDIKQLTVKARKLNRSTTVKWYRSKIDAGVQLSPAQWRRYNCALYYIGQWQLCYATELLTMLGYRVFRANGIEAEALCAWLKKNNLVDHICSTDKDLVLYSCDFLNYMDPVLGVVSYDEKANMDALGITDRADFLLAAIAAGTDYHPGLPGVAGKTALKLLQKDRGSLQARVLDEIHNYRDIQSYLTLGFIDQQCATTVKSMASVTPIPSQWTTLYDRLQALNFAPVTIKKLLQMHSIQ